MSTGAQPVVVLGAGLAGLTAATFLRRHGVAVRVFEAGAHIAGLARSERDADGFTYDFGAHFITNRLAAAVGCSADCRDMPRYGESVRLGDRTYSYPFGLMQSPRFVLSAAATKCTSVFRAEPGSAAEWYRHQYGARLAEDVAIPLTEDWSGCPAEELAASVGEKFATSLPRTMMLKAAGRMTRRTVAVGYCGTLQESPHVWHVYPQGGVGAICERLAEEIDDCIRTESSVEAIHVEHDRVAGVRVSGEDIAAAAVVSTAPVHILSRLVRGSDRLAYLARFRYRAMAFVNLRIEGPSGLPDVVTWTPGREFPFFRLSDIGMGLPWLVPSGKSQITADIGCSVGDDTWTSSDADLGARCIAALDKISPGVSKRYLGCRVMRTPLAYPVYHAGYETLRRQFATGTGIDNLVSVGRNGEFAHILMEDVFWRTRRKMLKLLDVLRAE